MPKKSLSRARGIYSINYLLTGLFLLFFTVVSAGLFLPGSVNAEEGYGPGTDRFKIELGGYFPSISTDLTFEKGDQEISLEDTLGLGDDDAVWRLDGYWRFAKRHRLGFGYYSLNREETRAISTDFDIGGETWYAGALVATEFDFDFYTLKYMYSFYQGEQWEISGGLGAYWVRVTGSLVLAAALDRPPTGNLPPGGPEDLLVGDRFESETFEGPLPYLALGFEYYITPKWLTSFYGGYLQLKINDYEGRILNAGAKIEYQFTKLFGLGLGYDAFGLKVDSDNDDDFSSIEYTYHGVQVYGILRF